MATVSPARVAAHTATTPAGRVENAITVLAALSWLAAMIHAAAIPEHWNEHRSFAVCFAALALLQAAWAVAFFRAPSRRLLVAAAVLSSGVIAVWTVSRTTGMPFGPEPWTPERPRVPDVAATVVELVLASGGLRLARDWRVPRWLLPLGTAVLLAGGVALGAGDRAH
jgi:hypothetical protein